MSAMQYYLQTQRADYNVCPYFYEREVKIMEITGIALQTVAAGEDVAFTETAVNGTKCIVHRQGSGIIKLRGITNQRQEVRIVILCRRSAQLMDLSIQCVNGKSIIN